MEVLKDFATLQTGLNVRDHLFTKLPVPKSDFTGQTIIVSGASSGLGLETARHLVRLKAEHIILAVRSEAKGAIRAALVPFQSGFSTLLATTLYCLSPPEQTQSSVGSTALFKMPP